VKHLKVIIIPPAEWLFDRLAVALGLEPADLFGLGPQDSSRAPTARYFRPRAVGYTP